MKFDFSSMFSLCNTLNNVMYDYGEEGNSKAIRQFTLAAVKQMPCAHHIGKFKIYEEPSSVLEYVRWFYATIPSVSIVDCTETLYLHLDKKIDFSEAELIDLATIQRVLEVVDNLFSFSTNIHPVSISIIDAEMHGRNGESIAVLGNQNDRGAIFLYHLWNHFDDKATPASVLIHELGHQLHFHLTGELYKIPESFYYHLDSIGADYTNLSEADLLEVFADTFLLAVTHKTKEFGDAFPEITDETKQLCFCYIQNLINNLS